MTSHRRLLIGMLGVFFSAHAVADIWIQGNITDIQINAAGNASDRVIVFGNFVPATGCVYNAVLLATTDNYFKESYAALLAAKLTNTPVRILFSYCDPASGLGRANAYTVLH